MASLPLPNSPAAAVWRALRDALAKDPVYAKAAVAMVFWEGDVDAARDLTAYPGAAVRFTPQLGGSHWFDEAAADAVLDVAIEISLAVPDAEDLLNLQNALLTSLNTITGGLRGTLEAAGATTGELLFGPFAFTRPPGTDGRILARGGFSLPVQRTL